MGQDDIEETRYSLNDEVPTLAGRRQEGRLLTLLRVGTLILGGDGIIDGRRELCLVRNISAMGMMIHVYSHLTLGEAVEVEMKTGQQIAGRVKWIDGSNVGLEFEASVDVMAMLASQMISQTDLKPRMPRVEVRAPAMLRMGGQIWRVGTRDISQGGTKIALDVDLPADADIVLSMEGFHSQHGVLRWCGDGMAGITFNTIIPWPQLVRWLKERREIGPMRENWVARPKTA